MFIIFSVYCLLGVFAYVDLSVDKGVDQSCLVGICVACLWVAFWPVALFISEMSMMIKENK